MPLCTLLLHARALVALSFLTLAASANAQIAISAAGSPSYAKAVAVPPGIAGMAPNLSLVYAGGGVNGPVGHGWSVQGISTITRCPATKAIDGAPKGVVYGPGDKLCLDGQRLIQTDESGSPTATQNATGVPVATQANDAQGLGAGQYREYRTEKDTYARIRAYDSSAGNSANGPTYFRVWTKAGQIYDYGAAPSADANTRASITAYGKTAVMVWAVARISDVVGNYIDFKYEWRDVAWGSGPVNGSTRPGSEWNIAEIQYTGNAAAGQAPANKVVFRYSDRTLDRAEAYQLGSKNVSVRRLDGIDTYVNSANPGTLGAAAGAVKARVINLAYDNGPVTKRSRLMSITECRGATPAICLPPTTFTYAAGGTEAFTANANFASSTLTTTALYNTTGTTGVLTSDFNGDGKTDILVWSDTPSLNKLYTSNGDGTFTPNANFNLTTVNLVKSDRCYYSIDADFNGDGITDILRIMRPTSKTGTSCGTVTNLLFIGSSNGSFTQYTVPSSIDFTQTGSTTLQRLDCIDPPNSGYYPRCNVWGDNVISTSRSQGANFHLIDVNGDGVLDIITTILPGFTWTATPPSEASLCASILCSRVFRGNLDGTFTELTATNLAHQSVYSDPPSYGQFFNRWRRPSVMDTNGDGLADLTVASGTWASRGDANGNFDYVGPVACLGTLSIDFNGDGRSDCINSYYNVTQQALYVGDGTSQVFPASTFNLISAGQELTAQDGFQNQTAGAIILDVNGDGRQDILRWKDDPTQNQVYLSNGDGSFTASTSFNLTGSTYQLSKSDGSATFTLGDFLGNGTIQILRLRNNPTAGAATSNQLYVKSDTTAPDQLLSVMSPNGIKTTLTYASLANSGGRYASDRGTGQAATYPYVDSTAAMPVVIASQIDSGVGSTTVTSEYAYQGMKAALDGRGLLGFRQTVQQNVAPNGDSLSIWTSYLLNAPYAGVASRTETRKGTWNQPSAQLLSRTINVYCDTTSGTDPNIATEAAPCATTAKVTRPYLRKSEESGWDLNGTTLPMVTTVNTYNVWGDPTNILVTTVGDVAGMTGQTYTKSTSNDFCAPDSVNCPNKISGTNWILGRLMSSSVTNTVPNLLPSVTASPGTPAP